LLATGTWLGNAWKFTRKQEECGIEFGLTTIDKKQAYFVHDNGAGFHMKYASKLFDPFLLWKPFKILTMWSLKSGKNTKSISPKLFDDINEIDIWL